MMVGGRVRVGVWHDVRVCVCYGLSECVFVSQGEEVVCVCVCVKEGVRAKQLQWSPI